MERTNLQTNYMFAPPCPAQENAIRTSHNRWEVIILLESTLLEFLELLFQRLFNGYETIDKIDFGLK